MADDTNNEFTNYEESDNNIQAIFTLNLTPSKTSQLINDSGFISSIEGLTYNELANKPQINGVTLEGNKTSNDLSLVDLTSEQTLSNKTIDASQNTISGLSLQNCDESKISYYCDLGDIESMPSEAKLATDVAITLHTPLIGKNWLSQPIHYNEENLDDFRNIGFSLRDNVAVLSNNNEWCLMFHDIYKTGSVAYTITDKFFTPDFKIVDLDTTDHFNNSWDSSTDCEIVNKTFSNSYMLRKNTIFFSKTKIRAGITINDYKDPNSKTERNYFNLASNEPSWFIPKTVFGVNLIAYKDSQKVFSLEVYTFVSGEADTECSQNEFSLRWWEMPNSLSPVESIINVEYDTVTKTYSGKQLKGYIQIGQDSYEIDTWENQKPYASYREVQQPYWLISIFQEVIDSHGNIGYCDAYWNDMMNTTSGYQHQPDSSVDTWVTIYKSLVPSSSGSNTWENTGDFKYTFKMFKAPWSGDNYKIAFKAYQLKNRWNDSIFQWTNIQGNKNDSFSGSTANEPQEARWPYNNYNDLWYVVHSTQHQNDGRTLCVKASEITETPTVGGIVPSGVGMFWDGEENQFEGSSDGETVTFETTTPQTALEYIGETTFIVENDRRDELEPYFSETDFGLFEKNNEGAYTKISDAYQWKCAGLFSNINNYNIKFAANKNGFNTPQGYVPNEDWSINNLNWWITQAWEIHSESSGITAWTGIPPKGAQPNQENYTSFNGQHYEYLWVWPVLNNGESVNLYIEDYVYTGNYNSDFLGRWTKLQNGGLGE